MQWACAWLTALCTGALWVQPARAARPDGAVSACGQLTFAAEQASCRDTACVLLGQARLRCDGRWLRADKLWFALRPDGQFAGAQASGQVLLIDGLQLLQAENITLAADGVSGRVAAARVSLCSAPPAAPADVPLGPRRLWLRGEVERRPDRALVAHGAQLTPCDCGPAALPSWRLDASRVDVRADGRRVWVFWPRLKLHLWFGRMVAVTPPLLPISLPLEKRAAGLLPPRLQFLSRRGPTVDLPLFVPLGPSWDVTFSPGIRTDWRASPRVTLAVRGRPNQPSDVQQEIFYTYDRRQRNVAGAAALPPRHRFWLRHHHTWQPQDPPRGPRPRLDADVAFVSDDDLLRDMMVTPAERAPAYLPTRVQATLSGPRQVLGLGGAWMQRLDNERLGNDGAPRLAPNNLAGTERSTLHRAPSLWWRLPFLRLGARPLALGAAASYDLVAAYGTRAADGLVPAAPAPLGALHLLGAQASLESFRRWHGLQLGARLAAQGALALGHAPPIWRWMPSLRLCAALPLVRAYASQLHALTPELALLGTQALAGALPASGPAAEQGRAVWALEQQFWQRTVLQARAGLRQSFWHRSADNRPATAPWLRLDVFVPVDLRAGRLLRPFAEAVIQSPDSLTLAAYASVSPQQLARGQAASALQETSLALSQRLGTWTLHGHYQRLSPTAERLQRTVWELAAATAPPTSHGRLSDETQPAAAAEVARGRWQHTLQLGLARAPGAGLQLGYTVSLQLPRTGQLAQAGDPACGAGRRACVTSHLLQLGWVSPCRCWRLDSTLSAAPNDLLGSLRFFVTLDLAGVRLSS